MGRKEFIKSFLRVGETVVEEYFSHGRKEFTKSFFFTGGRVGVMGRKEFIKSFFSF
jgi:hypothetical protein